MNLRAILNIVLLLLLLVQWTGKIANKLLLNVITNNGNVLKTISTGKNCTTQDAPTDNHDGEPHPPGYTSHKSVNFGVIKFPK